MRFHWKLEKLFAVAFLAAGSLSLATAGWANGPVSAAAVPGTVTVTDSDGGNGQAWGRGTGRNLTFSVATPAAFSALTWGVVSGTSPSLAFDGAVTPSTSEVMSYASSQSSLGSGMVRWVGAANLALASGANVTVPTRFTLTFTNSGGSAAAFFDSGGVNPGASLLVSGSVHANELFEMQYISALGGDNSWRPVLDLYDALPTPAGPGPQNNNGPVMTGVTTGFYYTTAVAGLTLEQHDANMTNQLNAIKGDTSFIKTDMVGRLTQIGNDLGDVKNTVNNGLFQSVSQIQQQVAQLVTASQGGGSSNAATKDDVNGLQKLLMVFWGVMPCPAEFGPQCPGVRKIQDLATEANVNDVKAATGGILIGLNQIQGNFGSLASQSSVGALSTKIDGLQATVASLQSKIVSLQDMIDGGTSFEVTTMLLPSPSKQLRWLVKTSRDGVAFNPSSVKVSTVSGATVPAGVRDIAGQVHVVTIAPGLHDISVDVVKSLSDGDAYLIEVSVVDNGVTLKGSALVSSATK